MYGLKPCHNLMTWSLSLTSPIRFQSLFNSVANGSLILVSSFQLFTLLHSEVYWKAAIEEFKEEVSRPPFVGVPSHFPDIELMGLATQIVREDEHLFLGFNSSRFYEGSSFSYESMESTGIDHSIIGQWRDWFQLSISGCAL